MLYTLIICIVGSRAHFLSVPFDTVLPVRSEIIALCQQNGLDTDSVAIALE